MLPPALSHLVDELTRLPSVGRKSAERMAFFLLSQPENIVRGMSDAIVAAKTQTALCQQCGNLTERHEPLCSICRNTERDAGVILVVSSVPELVAIEQSGVYKGLYHVTHGLISPVRRVGPEQLLLQPLWARLQPRGLAAELILALDKTLEGETTALYLQRELAGQPVRLSRLATGLPTGASLEWADAATIQGSLEGRRQVD